MFAIISGFISSLIAALFYSKLKSKLSFISPSDDSLRDLIKEQDKDVDHHQSKLQFAILMPLLVWLFLGNSLWALGGLLDIIRFRVYEYLKNYELLQVITQELYFKIVEVADGVIFGLYLLSFLCFWSGIKLILRIVSERASKAAYSE